MSILLRNNFLFLFYFCSFFFFGAGVGFCYFSSHWREKFVEDQAFLVSRVSVCVCKNPLAGESILIMR